MHRTNGAWAAFKQLPDLDSNKGVIKVSRAHTDQRHYIYIISSQLMAQTRHSLMNIKQKQWNNHRMTSTAH